MTQLGLFSSRSRLFFGLATLLVFLTAGHAQAGLITIGTDVTDNRFPLGDPFYSGEYQQIYTSAAFSGPVKISSIAFATSNFSAGASGTVGFTLSLSTTPFANLTSPSTNYASNRGADFTQVFSGSEKITALGNGTFDVVIATTPFLYNPSKGDLLLDVNITSPNNSPSAIYFEASQSATTARIFNLSGNGPATVGLPTDSTGLVTQINVTPAVSTPEPASLAMLGLGLAGAVAARRFRKARQS